MPSAVDEAVAIIKSELDDESVEWIRMNPREDVAGFLHLGFGTGVRNRFGLWGPNKKLLKSCGTDHAEECSGKIIRALWADIRAETDPALTAALDCQFALVNQLEVSTGGFFEMRLGDVLKSVQTQVDRQLEGGTEGDCQAELELSPVGDVDLLCWTRFEFEDEIKLGRFLRWFSWRNGFSIAHDPPKIQLRFHKACSWPEKPGEYFRPTGSD